MACEPSQAAAVHRLVLNETSETSECSEASEHISDQISSSTREWGMPSASNVDFSMTRFWRVGICFILGPLFSLELIWELYDRNHYYDFGTGVLARPSKVGLAMLYLVLFPSTNPARS